MNKMINEELKKLISEYVDSLDESQLETPPQCFFELFNTQDSDLIKTWNILIRYKNNTPEILEKEITLFNNFISGILGRNINQDLFDTITYHVKRLQDFGVDIVIVIPGYKPITPSYGTSETVWRSDEAIKEMEKRAWINKLNSNDTVFWNLNDLQRIYENMVDSVDYAYGAAIVYQDKILKREVIKVLEILKREKIILDYVKKDIYCGPPTYRKVKRYVPECDIWYWDKEMVDWEEAQGGSYQKRLKPFRVCLGDKLNTKHNWRKTKYWW